MLDLKQFLQSDGIDLTGWTLETALGISDDGTVIVGRGRDPMNQGVSWVATIPSPATSTVLSALAVSAVARRRRSRIHGIATSFIPG